MRVRWLSHHVALAGEGGPMGCPGVHDVLDRGEVVDRIETLQALPGTMTGGGGGQGPSSTPTS